MQFVENLYFIAIVIAFGAIVVVLIMRSSSGRSRREARRSLRARKRRLDKHRHRMAARPSTHSGDPWRRSIARAGERPHRATDSRVTASRDIPIVPSASFKATKPATGPLLDQDISPAEHLSIAEYLTKSDRDKAREREEAERVDQVEDGLTMRAVKYELVDEGEQSAADKDRKQAGFKP